MPSFTLSVKEKQTNMFMSAFIILLRYDLILGTVINLTVKFSGTKLVVLAHLVLDNILHNQFVEIGQN